MEIDEKDEPAEQSGGIKTARPGHPGHPGHRHVWAQQFPMKAVLFES